jgi:hypothetical protein
MFNSVVLDVVIGLIFIYLLYSMLATILQEMIATFIGLRARILRRGIERMLDDEINSDAKSKDSKALSASFYGHPLIKYLGENKFHSKPAYLTAANFSKVFIDLLRGENVQPGQSYNLLIHQALANSKTHWGEGVNISPQTLSYLKSIWADAEGDVRKFAVLLEQWYDDTMERASGWFKKKTRLMLFLIGLAMAVIFNVDTISIAGKLSGDPGLAKQLADNAAVYMQNHKESVSQVDSAGTIADKKTSDEELNTVIKKADVLMDSANALIHENITNSNKLLGLGWGESGKHKSNTNCFTCNFNGWRSIAGWIITALAVSLGAPFWFDLLNKLMQLRTSKKQEPVNTGKTPDKTMPTTLNINTQTSEEAVG